MSGRTLGDLSTNLQETELSISAVKYDVVWLPIAMNGKTIAGKCPR